MTQNATQDVPVQLQQGGKVLSIGSGGTLDLASGGVMSVGGGNQTRSVGITFGTPGTNTANVNIQLLDGNGNATANQEVLDIYLSDSAAGVGLTATSASGAGGAGAAGTDLLVRTAKKETVSQTNASGLYVLSIVDTANTGFYICVMRGSSLTVSAQLASGNY